MSPNQQALLTAAKETLRWLERRHAPDYLPKGMYEDLGLARLLALAIAAVEQDEAKATNHDEVLVRR